MAKRKSSQQPPQAGPAAPAGKPKRSATRVLVHRTADDAWEFLHPRCALTRREDLEEVQQMIAGGELEIAQDELRWLLADCRDFLEAHYRLGEIALEEEDYRLARGHFGYAYQIGIKALDRAGNARPLPYDREANRAFFEAGKGLAFCLVQLNKRKMARDVIERLLSLDATDPLGLRGLIK